MKIEVMTRSGDECLAEINENTSPEELQWIDQQFQELRKKGYSAFTKHEGRRVDNFDRTLDDDLILVAPIVGG